jgi:hypothetical protein
MSCEKVNTWEIPNSYKLTMMGHKITSGWKVSRFGDRNHRDIEDHKILSYFFKYEGTLNDQFKKYYNLLSSVDCYSTGTYNIIIVLFSEFYLEYPDEIIALDNTYKYSLLSEASNQYTCDLEDSINNFKLLIDTVKNFPQEVNKDQRKIGMLQNMGHRDRGNWEYYLQQRGIENTF